MQARPGSATIGGGGGGGGSAVPLPAPVSTMQGGALLGRATFTAVPPGRALLEDGGAVAAGSVSGWNVVTLGDVMSDGTWEWEVELVGGSNTCLYAVFEGPPRSDGLPNAPDANVLNASMAGTMRHIRGPSDQSGPPLRMRVGQRLRARYQCTQGTVEVSVDGGPSVRALDGVRRGDVRAGFFMSSSTRLRLCSFGRVDAPEAPSSAVRSFSARDCASVPLLIALLSWCALTAAACGADDNGRRLAATDSGHGAWWCRCCWRRRRREWPCGGWVMLLRFCSVAAHNQTVRNSVLLVMSFLNWQFVTKL